jgi:hypothetical protein
MHTHIAPRTASYVTVTPHPPFVPGLCILTHEPPRRGATLVLPTGDGLLAVQLSDAADDACVPAADAPDGVCSTPVSWVGEEDETGAGTPAEAPETPSEPEAHASASQEPSSSQSVQTPPPPCRGAALAARVTCRFDAEQYTSRVMAAALATGLRLVDYSVQLVVTHPGGAGGAHPLAVLLIVAAFRRTGSSSGGEDHGVMQPPPGAPRLVALVASVACGSGAGVRLLQCRELRPAAPGALPTALSATAASLAGALRRKGTAPVPAAAALPHALSNASVLACWRSADAIRHPWLPICILGFGVPATPEQ